MKNVLRAASILALALAALAASAQSSFYGGDPDRVNGIASERNTAIGDARVYDDFTLGATTAVQSVFGNFALDTTITGLHYEIRQGISTGNGGTLLFSGDLAATVVPTGISLLNEPVYRVTGTPVGVTLGPGTYFLDVAVIGTGTGFEYLATTSGANSVGAPIGNFNSFYTSTTFSQNFVPVSVVGGPYDFSLGLVGRAVPVPEPSAFAALGLGAIAVLRRRKA